MAKKTKTSKRSHRSHKGKVVISRAMLRKIKLDSKKLGRDLKKLSGKHSKHSKRSKRSKRSKGHRKH